MLIALEIILLALGLVILVTGQVPRFLHDRNKHPLLAEEARLLGALLLMPLPLAFSVALMLNAVFTDQPLTFFTTYSEPASIVLALILFVLLQTFLQKATVMKTPSDSTGRANWEDRKKIARWGRQAILYQIIGSFILTAPVFFPLSWRRADEARSTSKRVGHSDDYRQLGAILRVTGRVLFGLYFLVIIFIAARLMTAP